VLNFVEPVGNDCHGKVVGSAKLHQLKGVWFKNGFGSKEIEVSAVHLQSQRFVVDSGCQQQMKKTLHDEKILCNQPLAILRPKF
jgi:hypothetical protein